MQELGNTDGPPEKSRQERLVSLALKVVIGLASWYFIIGAIVLTIWRWGIVPVMHVRMITFSEAGNIALGLWFILSVCKLVEIMVRTAIRKCLPRRREWTVEDVMAFKKITDEDRAALDAEDAARTEHQQKINTAIELLTSQVYYRLSEKEQDFVRNCRMRASTYLHLSEPQEKWLFDLAKAHELLTGQELLPAAEDDAGPKP